MAQDQDSPRARRRRLQIRVWLPVVVLTGLTALLGVMYLGYIADPEENLHDFPIALVNSDVGDNLGTPESPRHVDFGQQVAEGLIAGIPADKIDLRILSNNESDQQLQSGKIYGAIVIPSDFSKRLTILGMGSVGSGDIERPIITLQTNPRMGAFGAQIMRRIGDQALSQVNAQVGQQLIDQVNSQLAAAPDGPPPEEISAAARVTLAEPIRVVSQEYHPVPAGGGEGLVAFFYALLLLLAGMVGAMVVHTMIDSALGIVPTEYGPWYVHHPAHDISRLRTLLIKWGVLAVAAVLISAVFLGVAKIIGVPVDHPMALFLYGALAIIAVGVTGLSVLAVFGSPGLLINLILFVILGLPSSSGTVPVEAIPQYLRPLAEFEPMHQVFVAVRAILFFDARYSAGLGLGLGMTLLGLLIGLIMGAGVTRFYDHHGLRRRS